MSIVNYKSVVIINVNYIVNCNSSVNVAIISEISSTFTIKVVNIIASKVTSVKWLLSDVFF